MNECRWCVFLGWHRGPRLILRAFGWHLWIGLRLVGIGRYDPRTERGTAPFEFYVGRFYG